MEPSVKTPGDYFEILKRRKWSLILPALIILLAAAVVALALPSIYKSTATILIEEQEIPADFVATTVTSFVEQRLIRSCWTLSTGTNSTRISGKSGLPKKSLKR